MYTLTGEERKEVLLEAWMDPTCFTEEELENYADLFLLQEHYTAMDQIDDQLEELKRAVFTLQEQQEELALARRFHSSMVSFMLEIPKEYLLQEANEAGLLTIHQEGGDQDVLCHSNL